VQRLIYIRWAGRGAPRPAQQGRRVVQERERIEIGPVVKELLLSDPELVAWLAPHDDEAEEDEPAAAA
jgi:hypothetical protein